MNTETIEEITRAIVADRPISADLAGKITVEDWQNLDRVACGENIDCGEVARDYLCVNAERDDFSEEMQDVIFIRQMSRSPQGLRFTAIYDDDSRGGS